MLYIKIHEPSIKKEIEMSKLSQSDKILHIGCGAIPYTLIVIVKEIGVSVLGIDYKSRIVDLANNYLKRFNLSDMIRIETGEGQKYDASGFNVVIISYGIEIQEVVLHHILDSVKDGTRIILRRSTLKKNDYIDSIVKKYSTDSLKLLLTQESILLVKKNN
jgi:precorrin-6B methylase 2